MTTGDEPRLVEDPLVGEPVLLAPRRQSRPILTDVRPAGDRCPFCPGHEEDTPPAVLAEDRDGREVGAGAWEVRAFPNLFAAWSHHEVFAEGALHAEQPARVAVPVWARVVAAWGKRLRALEDRPGVECAFLFKNVGRQGGASIAHNHSQLLGLPEQPPRLRALVRRLEREGDTVRRALEPVSERRIAEHGRFAALAPPVPRLPFETLVVTADPATDLAELGDGDRRDLAAVLRAVFLAFERAFDAPPFNGWLMRTRDGGVPWHYVLQPRTGYLAGLELGGGMSINSVPPVEAAARLRSALDRTD